MGGYKFEPVREVHHSAFTWAEVLEDVLGFAATDAFYLILCFLCESPSENCKKNGGVCFN
jgi:hypothetical protein